ncbi:MAG TPA: hypothetical protein VGE07_01475 [Herpetosiphonaceae bacterium]
MPYATRLSPRWWLVGLCLLVTLGFAASGRPQGTSAQEPTLQEPAPSLDEEIVAGHSPGLDPAAVSAPYTRTDTFVLHRFQRLILETSRSSLWPAGVPGTHYEFRLSVPSQTGVVSNVVVMEEGAGSCIREQDNDIICDGEITMLSISYDYNFRPRLMAPDFSALVGFAEDFPVDYRAILVYPAGETFNYAVEAPDTHDQPNRTLTWSRANSVGWSTRAWFTSDQLWGLDLPLLMKGE